MNDTIQMWLEIAADEITSSGDSSATTSPDTTTSTVGNEAGTETTPAGDSSAAAETTPIEFEIDGQKFTADEIKEWRKGSMRQSDYTKKTQEIARQRREMQEAVEVYEFLRANPEIAKKLAEEAPEKAPVANRIVDSKLYQLGYELQTMKIDQTLSMLKSKDPDLDEIAVLELANQKNWSIEDAYNNWRGSRLDDIIKQKLSEQSKKITEKIKSNNSQTATLMTPKPTQVDNFGLTEVQMRYADKLNMSYEEYKKWQS